MAAHLNAPFGLIGIGLVTGYSIEADQILHPWQKAMVASFSCCLVPPREIVNPVRVGQAEVQTWEIPLMEKIRAVSWLSIPLMKIVLHKYVLRWMLALKPDSTKTD